MYGVRVVFGRVLPLVAALAHQYSISAVAGGVPPLTPAMAVNASMGRT